MTYTITFFSFNFFTHGFYKNNSQIKKKYKEY